MLVWEQLPERTVGLDGEVTGSALPGTTYGVGEDKGELVGRHGNTYRAQVPGGWLIKIKSLEFHSGYQEPSRPVGMGGAFFLPDPDHLWDGSSIGDVPPLYPGRSVFMLNPETDDYEYVPDPNTD